MSRDLLGIQYWRVLKRRRAAAVKREKQREKKKKTGGEKDSGVCPDDEATLVATETLESTILGSKFTPEFKRAKDIQLPSLDLTPVNVTTIPRLFSSFDGHIAKMKRRALLKQRPDKPELLCCDIHIHKDEDEAAEVTAQIRLFGRPEYKTLY